jgi:hypothetical protein
VASPTIAAPPAAPATEVATAVPPRAPDSAAVPAALTDGVRADILAAVDRANAGWATAKATLDTSGLSDAVAGQELTNDLAEVNKLKAAGHSEKDVQSAFNVTDVSLYSPGHATVHTTETWTGEIDSASTGRLIQRIPPTNYVETYTVECQNGGWIVTKNDLHQT